jgi:hypothetical protein
MKFPNLPAATVLGGTEIVPLTQGGTDKRTTTQGIANLATATTAAYDNTDSGLTAETVQAAIDEMVASPPSVDAEDVPYDNAVSGLAATEVQAALDELAAGAGGTPAGSTKQIQYNNAGAFGAEAGFEYDAATNTLTVSNITTAGLLLTAASASGGAGLRVPHGAAPTAPTNGDVWTTTTGIYVRVNGATVGPLSASGGMTNPMTTTGDIIYSSSGSTPTRLGVSTNGFVLTLVAGVPAWAAASGGVSSVNGDTGAVIVLAPICIACSDETTNLTAGVAKVTFRTPYAMTLTGVRASLTTAQAAGSIFTVDINEGGTSILSTKLTIDNTEKTSTTAAIPAVISDTSLADDAEITIDIDQVGTALAKGLKIWLIGYQT